MDKVLSITNRLEDKKRKKNAEIHRRKAQTILRMVQCSSCHMSCAMCGAHLDAPDMNCTPGSSDTDMVLCEGCRAEYIDFLEISNGNKTPDIFWHNKEWLGLWSAWLDFHRAIERFKISKEFNQLIKEPD